MRPSLLRFSVMLLALFALSPIAACDAEEDPEQEASDIQRHIQDELIRKYADNKKG